MALADTGRPGVDAQRERVGGLGDGMVTARAAALLSGIADS
ncbi:MULTISPECIES: hypothetical protein [unclassified Streptomyces]